MTISTTASAITYQGNGATTLFPFAFPVLSAGDLQVTVTDNTQSPAMVTTLNATQYSASGIGNAGGGSVIYPLSGSPLAAGLTLTIRRVVAYVQDTSIVNQGGFYPDVLEGALDCLTEQTQQLAEGLSRAMQVPVGSGLDPNAYLPTIQAAEMAAAGSAVAAAVSAATSATQATNAAASAVTATTQAANATTQATNAAASAATATTKATAAATSATNAATSETTAATQAGAAAISAAAAAGSATAAATSAANGAVSATSAAGSATNAAAQAATATTQAGNAAASATASAASATASATSASQAQAAITGAVKVDAGDTTAGYLAGKLVAGANIAFTIANAGANETLSVAVTGLGTAAALTAGTGAGQVPTASQIPGLITLPCTAAQFSQLQTDVIAGALKEGVDTASAPLASPNFGEDVFNADDLSAVSGTTGQTYDGVNKLYSSGISTVNQCTGGAASASSTYGSTSAANVFDGSLSTTWQATSGSPQWVEYAFAAPVHVLEVTVTWNYSGTATYALQYSDDNATWATAGTASGLTTVFDIATTNTFADAGAHKYWRLNITAYSGSTNMVIVEIAMYGAGSMTLVSAALSPAPSIAPTQGKAVVLWKDLSGTAALNTDFVFQITSNGGTTWTPVTLADSGDTVGGYHILTGAATLPGSGTAVQYKITTTTKSQQVKGVGLIVA